MEINWSGCSDWKKSFISRKIIKIHLNAASVMLQFKKNNGVYLDHKKVMRMSEAKIERIINVLHNHKEMDAGLIEQSY